MWFFCNFSRVSYSVVFVCFSLSFSLWFVCSNDRVSLHLLSIGDPDAQSRNMSTGDENQPTPTVSVTSVLLKIPLYITIGLT